MALRPGKIALQFSGGIDTDTDSKQVAPVKLLDLQNAVFTQNTTLVKRSGYRALSRVIEAAGSDYSGAKALAQRGDETLVATATATLSYRPAADRWASTGSPLSITASERPIVKTGTEQSQVDAGTNSNVTAVAWMDSRGGIWWAVLEESTGRVLRPAAQLAPTGTQPRVVPVGTALHIYYAEHAARVIWVAVVDVANPTAAVTPTQLVTDLSSNNIGYDVCATTLGTVLGSAPATPALIAWPGDAANIRIGYVDVSGVIGSVLTSLPPAVSYLFAPSNNTNIGVAYDNDQGVALVASTAGSVSDVVVFVHSLTGFTEDPGVFFPGMVPRGHTIGWAGPRLHIVIEDTSGAGSERDTRLQSYFYDPVSAAVVRTAPYPLRGLSLASRMFIDDRTAYVWAVHDVPFFSVYLLIRVSDGAVVARTMPTIAHGTQVNSTSTWFSTASVDPTDARKWRTPLLYNEQIEALAGQFAETGIRWVTIDMDDPNAWQTAAIGRGLYMAGAEPWHYDGDRWAEAGFHYAPDGVITATPATSTGALTTGLYTYFIWYEEVDAQGEVHRGPTSVGTAVTLAAGNNQVTLTGPMYTTTGRRRVRVCIARSEVNDAVEFFRVTSLDPSATGSNGYILNDPTVDTWTFVDRMSDATLITQEPLYTTGGVLSNDPPPMAGGVLTVGKNRLFWTDPSDSTLIRYSQEIEDGFAVDFAEPLKQKLDPGGGAITAIGILDDAVIPFREAAVNVIVGPGPLPNPTQETATFAFSPAALVTSDVGCVNPRSIVQTPIGIGFKSAKGIRLLGRDRKVVDIGEDVRDFDAQDVTAATLFPTFNRIVFLTSSGSTLQYDYQRAQWSRFTNHTGLDALIVGGLYYYLRTDGRVFVETPGLYRDDSSHIPMVLEMAWLKMAGYLQGWQRIWYAQFLGEWRSPHKLRVRYRLNYELQWSAPFDQDVNSNYTATAYGSGAYGAGPYGSTGSSVYQRRIHIGKECQSIQFQIQDVELTDDYGAAFELSELVITGGLKGNLYKLEAARSN